MIMYKPYTFLLVLNSIFSLRWADELDYLKSSAIDIDFDGLLNARKRIIIRDIFFDPVAAEKRRLAEEVVTT